MKVLAKALLVALLLPAAARGAEERSTTRKWDAETLRLASLVPVQDGGRIKPLSTLARFRLLTMNGRITGRNQKGEKLSAMEWLLDSLFYPEVAQHYPILLVRTSEVLDALRLPHEGKKKSDRYSYAELRPGRGRLGRLAAEYREIEAGRRTAVEEQIVHLATNVFLLEQILFSLEFANSTFLAVFPPASPEETEWRAPADLISAAASTEEDLSASLKLLEALAEMARSRDDPDRFRTHLMALRDGATRLAEARGEYGKIGLEVFFYRVGFFKWSLIVFVLGFVLLALSWLRPGVRLLAKAVPATLVVAVLPLVAGITVRCLIRGRPPVTTLYETILFITATGVITALAIEYMNRRRIALALASVIGVAGLFLAMKYEIKDGQDTMPSLVAVLDTNFWLSTHVTTVTLGYSAGLLAAILANVFILGRLFGLKRDDPGFYRTITRMVYGVICFGLFFSIIGTILGGIWANYSWGRFWGWDPKENGALMIVLWELAVLHGRMGGYLRQLGLNLAAVFGGIIVVFSWWGVNLLGVGLHSYGFTSGLLRTILLICGIQVLVMVAGGIVRIRDRYSAVK